MPVKRHNAGPSEGQKRTRFASPPPKAGSSSRQSLEPEDDLLEEDLPQGAQAAKSKSRKQLKDAGGYGSDSSNDDEGVVPSRRADGRPEEEEDVDMFADDVDDKTDKGKGKEKEKDKKEFMSLDEIEGQEFSGSRRRGGSGTGDDDSEGEDAAADRKRKEGLDGDMGIDITPFNMKGEMEEGKFTADGEEYIANDADPNDKHDIWLRDVDEEGMRKAREAHLERERLEREREEKEEEDSYGGGKERQIQLLRVGADLMERGETVLEALQRLGAEDKKREAASGKKSWVERQKERKAQQEKDKDADPIKTSNPFNNLSNIVSALTAIGNLDVYSLSRESMLRMLPQSTPTGQTNGSAKVEERKQKDDRAFQYRFSMKYVRALPEAQRPVERETFGPFPIDQLRQWRNTGFFGGPACENVELKQVAPKQSESWGSWEQIVGAP